MTNPDILKSLWASDIDAIAPMSPDELRRHAHKFRRKIARRNTMEYTASAVVIAVFSAFWFLMPLTLARIGALMIVIGTLYVIWCLHSKASAEKKGDLRTDAAWLTYHRSQLVRQREALQSVLSWYLLPILPGTFVFIIGTSPEFMNGASALAIALSVLPHFTFVAFVIGAVWGLNMKASKALTREINAVDDIAG